MNESVREIVNGMEKAYLLCQTISDGSGCDRCPLRSSCLEETPYLEVADNIAIGTWEEFTEFADDVANYISDEDMRAHFDDMARKAERDEYYD